MGKYTKMALVLLYLLQLVVVFREQLAHLYKTAVQTVHGTERALNPHEGFRAALKRAVTMARPATREAIAAAVIPVAVTIAGTDDEDGPEHPHDEDDKKDRAKKWRHLRRREFIIVNLWGTMRALAALPASTGARADAVIRSILAACIPAPSAKG